MQIGHPYMTRRSSHSRPTTHGIVPDDFDEVEEVDWPIGGGLPRTDSAEVKEKVAAEPVAAAA